MVVFHERTIFDCCILDWYRKIVYWSWNDNLICTFVYVWFHYVGVTFIHCIYCVYKYYTFFFFFEYRANSRQTAVRRLLTGWTQGSTNFFRISWIHLESQSILFRLRYFKHDYYYLWSCISLLKTFSRASIQWLSSSGGGGVLFTLFI